VGFYNEFEKAAELARYAVNVFPWLSFAPSWLVPWRRSGKQYLARDKEMICRMFFGVEERMASTMEEERKARSGAGMNAEDVVINRDMSDKWEMKMEMKQEDEEPWSIAKLYHLNPSKWSTTSPATSLTPNEAAYTFGAFIEASMAGTPAALKLFLQAMLWYPEWQDQIYEAICQVCSSVSPAEPQSKKPDEIKNDRELDGGVGVGDGYGDRGARKPRMPSLHDAPQLPITRAVIKEMLRWRPTLPDGFPHRLIRDDLCTPQTQPPQTQHHQPSPPPKLHPHPTTSTPPPSSSGTTTPSPAPRYTTQTQRPSTQPDTSTRPPTHKLPSSRRRDTHPVSLTPRLGSGGACALGQGWQRI
jgi:hypothetical protein